MGTINLDAPFLGLHPGIIVSGISSLFRPKQKSTKESTTELDPSPSTSGIASPNYSTYSGLPALSPTTTATSRPSADSPTGSQGFSAPAPAPAMTFDPNFNPVFPNDVRMQDRGWWQNIAHFVRKHHSEGIIDAATKHFMSHLEYGGTLLDYNTLKARYESLRKLEDLDDLKRRELPYGPRRVRFIQYYTMCYGIPKEPKSKTEPRPGPKPTQEKLEGQLGTSEAISPRVSHNLTPSISLQDRSRSEIETCPTPQDPNGTNPPSSAPDQDRLSSVSAQPGDLRIREETNTRDSVDKSSNQELSAGSTNPQSETTREAHNSLDAVAPPGRPSVDADTAAELADAVSALHLDLPAVPEPPEKPKTPDLEMIEDKAERRRAEKEARQRRKAYEQAVRSREKAVRERQKVIDKRRKKKAQEAERRMKEEAKLKKKEDSAATASTAAPGNADDDPPEQAPEEAGLVQPANVPTEPVPGPFRPGTKDAAAERIAGGAAEGEVEKTKKNKKKKERMFCNLPKTHRDPATGGLDDRWVRVFMRDTDEVGAHTGLFFPAGEHYDRLVGDIVDVVVGWVQEDASVRTILASEV